MERALLVSCSERRTAGGARGLQRGGAAQFKSCRHIRFTRADLFKTSQWNLAIEDYTSALRLNPQLASSLYARGLAKLQKGDLAGGNADLAAALAIDPKVREELARYGVR